MTTLTNDPTAIAEFEYRLDKMIRQTLKSRPQIDGSEWANQNYYISPEGGTTPGSYDWRRAPYQREWLDVMCNDTDQKIVLMTIARVGKTICMKAATAYWMSEVPTSIMWMLPTEQNARQFSGGELDAMIRDCPTLKSRVKSKNTRDHSQNAMSKKYTGGVLWLTGAESPAGVHGKTIRVLLADETDRMPASICKKKSGRTFLAAGPG